MAEEHVLARLFERWRDEGTEEGLALEFKSGKLLDYPKGKSDDEDRRRYDLAKAVASLANTDGGAVAIGIEERPERTGYGRAGAIEPAPAEWRRERLMDILDRDITPRIGRLDVEQVEYAGGMLFLVRVPISFLGHMNRAATKSGAGEYRTRRATGVSEPLDGREVRQLVMRAELPDPIVEARLDGSRVMLYVANRASVLRDARVTLFLEGADPRKPTAFKGPEGGLPSIGGFPGGGAKGARGLDGDSVYPGAPLGMGPIEGVSIVLALLQAPGIEARLFGWVVTVSGIQPLARDTPGTTWWENPDIRDQLGNSIPFVRWV